MAGLHLFALGCFLKLDIPERWSLEVRVDDSPLVISGIRVRAIVWVTVNIAFCLAEVYFVVGAWSDQTISKYPAPLC
jgi:hypothetical protein